MSPENDEISQDEFTSKINHYQYNIVFKTKLNLENARMKDEIRYSGMLI